MQFHNEVNILVFDIGGGTTDISILNIDEGFFEVITTYGDNFLGGENFTKIIINSALDNFKKMNKSINMNDNILKKKI